MLSCHLLDGDRFDVGAPAPAHLEEPRRGPGPPHHGGAGQRRGGLGASRVLALLEGSS